MVKKIVKYIVLTLVIVTVVSVVLPFLLYVPPIQRYLKNTAEGYVTENFGMQLSIDRVSLRFPLRLAIDNATVLFPAGDTLFHAGELRAGVAMLPLLKNKVIIRRLTLNNLQLNYTDSLSNMAVNADIGRFSLRPGQINLAEETAEIPLLELADGKIFLSMHLADSTSPDTVPLKWKIMAEKMKLENIDFDMEMYPDETHISVLLKEGILRKGTIDLFEQTVDVTSIELIEGTYTYLYDTVAVAAPKEALPDTIAEKPWTVRIGQVRIEKNAVTYGVLRAKPQEGFDVDHIKLSNVDLSIDSVYNKGTEVSALLNNLAFVERSGLKVNSMRGRFSMDSATINLSGFNLRTPKSSLQADAQIGVGITVMQPSTPVNLQLSGNLNMSEMLLLYPLASDTLRRSFGEKSLTLSGNVKGSLRNFKISELQLAMADHFNVTVEGEAQNVATPQQATGKVRLEGNFEHLALFKPLFLPDSLAGRVDIPDNITLRASLNAREGAYFGRTALQVGDEGRLSLRGFFNPRTERYNVSMTADSLPVYRFLPADSLGLLTLNLKARGAGLDIYKDSTNTSVDLTLGRFDYGGYTYDSLSIAAAYSERKLQGRINSTGNAMQIDLALDGDVTEEKIAAQLKGTVAQIDLFALRLSPKRMSASLALDVSAAVTNDSTVSISAGLKDVAFTSGWTRYSLTPVSAEVFSGKTESTASIRSGDMVFDFKAPMPADSFFTALANVGILFNEQFNRRSLDFGELQDLIPAFNLNMTAGWNNIINNYLRMNDMQFDRLTMASSSSLDAPLQMRLEMNGISTQGVALDTVVVYARQRDRQLGYFLRMANKEGNLNKLGFVYLYGNVADNHLLLNVMQRDRERHQGFNFGCNVVLTDSALTMSVISDEPIFGFDRWTNKKDNYLTYNLDSKELYADIELTNGDRLFSIKSARMKDYEKGALRLAVKGVDLENIASLLPVPLPIEGTLNTDVLFGMKNEVIDSEGEIWVDGLKYDHQLIGKVELDVLYRYREGQRVGATLSVNDSTALTVRGSYRPGRRGRQQMNVAIEVTDLPLSLANVFLPQGLASLSGSLKGKVSIRNGRRDRMMVDGEIGFTETLVSIPMTGGAFRLTDDKIVLKDGILRLDNYALYGRNNSPMSLSGTVDLTQFENITTNLSLTARNFQAINVRQSKTSPVFGKAAIDMGITINGPLDKLTVRGDVKVLNGTDITYVLRDSPVGVDEKEQNLVTFLSFDLLDREDDFKVESVRADKGDFSGLNMLVNVNIDETVKMGVNLSENGQNRISLQGGGTLAYTMNQFGDVRFSGRYYVTEGRVRYAPPIISEKNFIISEGSYVDWNGDMLDPTISITAVETVNSNVSIDENNNRVVKFDISIIIKNKLEDLSITMDVAAPNELTVQNQLSGMTAEQRSAQAMNLLIYNTYTGGGNDAKFNAMNPLNQFVSQQLNNWSRNNLKNVDLSFGINTYDEMVDGAASTRTDYSYKLSKTLFDNNFRVSIGGRVSSDADPNQNLKENLVDNISLEYLIGQRENMFVKVFRNTGYESVLEGEVIKTGVGFVVRKRVVKLRDLFKLDFLTRKQKKEQAKKVELAPQSASEPEVRPESQRDDRSEGRPEGRRQDRAKSESETINEDVNNEEVKESNE